ncbi:MAG: tetratricopeptide repeat protein, partial [Acidobacteriota bacterium]
LIVVAGDHGESLGEHQEAKHGFYIYNAVLQVPLIFRFPASEHAGKRISDNVSLVDVFPTLAQSLRLPRRDYSEVQGDGLLSLILGRERPPAEIYAESYYPRFQFGWSQLRTLIRGQHKYILAPQPELFDLESDFAEKHNQASENQALANRLREEFQAFAGRLQNPEGASSSQSEVDPATLERLRSLGYASLSLGAPLADDGFESLPDPKQQIGTYNELGRLFEQSEKKQYQQAIAGYKRLLSSQPGLKLARYKLAQAYYHSNRFEEALKEFKEVVKLGGPEAMATFDLAQTYYRLGRFEEAALGFEQTLERDPEHQRARINLGVCYKNLGRIPEAIGELEKALEKAPDDVFALGNLGVSYSLAGRHEEAVGSLQKAIRLSPQNALLHANLATALQRMGRTEEAQEHLSIARRLNPDLFKRRRQ